MTRLLRVLLVEDRPSDAELIVLRLEEEGLDFEWSVVDAEAAYLAALDVAPDLILSDWNLPEFGGLRALELMRDRGLDIPFVIVSGTIGEEVAVDAIHRGADDYVLKDRLGRLGSAVNGALERKRLRDDQRRAESELRLAATVFASSAEGVTITDPAGTILAVNKAFTKITGYTEVEVVGQNSRILQSGRQDVTFYRDMWAALVANGSWRGELWNRRKDGGVFPEWITISAVKDADGRTTNYVGVFTDIGDAKQAQQELDFLAHHDALTGLPNRTLLLDRLGQAIRRAAEAGEEVAVVHIDLDRFGDVNDALGHLVGDELLRAAAARIRDQLAAGETLARLGGDEFVLVLEHCQGAETVGRAVRNLQERLAMPNDIDGHEIVVTATAGISLYPADAADAETMLHRAETALRLAKSQEQDSLGFFEVGLAAEVEARLAVGRELRGATTRGQLVVHYQPLVSFSDGALAGAEALVRWQHPERGLIPPGVFIPIAEELGIIGEIGEWVLRQACRQVASWDAAGIQVPRVAVNLSAQQLDRGDLATIVRSALEAAGVAPERLELEMTESMAVRRPELSAATLAELRGMGVDIAMDDFGTGLSSLGQLKRIPMDRLKIDLSFVRDIGVDAASDAIIRATIAFAGSLGLSTVAEGVERADQARFLAEAGCDVAQGYLYGRPMPADEFPGVTTAWGEHARPARKRKVAGLDLA